MKRRILVIFLLINFLFRASSHAGSYVTSQILDSYVLGAGFQIYDRPVIQTEVGHIFENGFGLSVWGSLPASLNDVGANAGTEVDLNVWYSFNPVTVGAAYYCMSPGTFSSIGNDIFQVNAEVSKKVLIGNGIFLTPCFRAEYNFPADDDHCSETTGLYLIPSISLAYELNDQVRISLKNKAECDMGGYGADKALIMILAPNFSFKISETLSANVGVNIYLPAIKTDDDIRKNLYVPYLGVSYSF